MSLKIKCIIAFVVLFVLVKLLPVFVTSVFAGECRVQRQQVYQYQYAHPVLLQQVYPAYYYSAGAAIQEEALLNRLKDKLKLEQRSHEFKTSVGFTKCASCHKPGTKAVAEDLAPVFFDLEGKLTANEKQVAKMLTAAKLGSMPPAKELTDDEYLKLKSELEPLTKAGDR